MREECFSDLSAAMTVKQFLTRNSGNKDTYENPAVTVGRDDGSTSLRDLAVLMLDNHLHRVWLVDTSDPPKGVGCISLTDILLAVYTSSSSFRESTVDDV